MPVVAQEKQLQRRRLGGRYQRPKRAKQEETGNKAHRIGLLEVSIPKSTGIILRPVRRFYHKDRQIALPEPTSSSLIVDYPVGAA
jgi:hypothetical protein